jgi:hypothetical protein
LLDRGSFLPGNFPGGYDDGIALGMALALLVPSVCIYLAIGHGSPDMQKDVAADQKEVENHPKGQP